MHDEEMVALTGRAIEAARAAWDKAHQGLPRNPMTKTAAIPATGILAAALLTQFDEDDEAVTARTERAIVIARRAWELTRRSTPGNPMAATAEKSVIGIIAAGVLNYLDTQRET